MQEYLTNPDYKDKDYFLAEEDVVYFSIPLLGTFHFPKNTYWLLNIGVFFLLLHTLSKERNIRWKSICLQSVITMAISLGLVIIGATWRRRMGCNTKQLTRRQRAAASVAAGAGMAAYLGLGLFPAR